MWTHAAYDNKLGLIYVRLGNTTPDYYGINRPASSDQYNSSLVALNVNSGREKWKFQTIHHDLWDYDLPSQPALIDIPDNNGNIVPAVMQTTKRGQIFLLNRITGEPITEVEEKSVPSKNNVPEEPISPTQPYSVDMRTIAETLTENKMWGITLFDQLACRIQSFGTISAIDLKTKKIAWQVPIGTAKELGPLGIKTHLPIPLGMPTYAGGLLFFASSQDYYLRALDSATGKELWKYPLPIGSSATPMTYISQKTGKQYVVTSVGGAAHSDQIGDYVIAFSL